MANAIFAVAGALKKVAPNLYIASSALRAETVGTAATTPLSPSVDDAANEGSVFTPEKKKKRKRDRERDRRAAQEDSATKRPRHDAEEDVVEESANEGVAE